jgi:hypothetical protein
VVGALGAAAGCLLPWTRGGGYADIGLEFPEGVLILILSLVVTALTIYAMVSSARWPRAIALLPAVGSLVLMILIVIDIVRASQQWQANPLDFVGWGIVVVLIGSILATAGAFRSLRKRY